MFSVLSPKIDIVFKLLFSKVENSDLLISFLTAVLNPSSPILKVTVLNPEIPKEIATDKSVILDVVAELNGGKKIDIEMQVDNRHNLRQRILFYLSRLHQSQLAVGQEFQKILPSVSIALLGYKETDEERFHTIYEMRERTSHKLFNEDLSVHLLELPKLHDYLKRHPNEIESGVVQWSRFFNLTTDAELEKLAMEQPIFRRAETALKQISGDAETRELARLREGARINLATALHGAEQFGRQEGRQEGLQEGRQEGLQEGRQEGLQEGLQKGQHAQKLAFGASLLAEDMPVETVARLSGLSPEEVQKLKVTKT